MAYASVKPETPRNEAKPRGKQHHHTMRQELVGRKLIKCPHCRKLLIHTDPKTLISIYAAPQGKKKTDIPGLIVMQCVNCKKETGLTVTTGACIEQGSAQFEGGVF
jgi:hypothetical protein